MTPIPIDPKLHLWLLTDPEEGGATSGCYLGFWCAQYAFTRYREGSFDALCLAVAVEHVVRIEVDA